MTTKHRDVTAAQVYAESAAQTLSPVDLYRQEVAQRLTFEDVYGNVRWLQRSGRQRRGACPLHGGSNPNFVVNVATLQWWCHVCQKGGGPIEYLNGGDKARGEDFTRIVRELAEIVGVTPSGGTPRTPRPVRHIPPPERKPRPDPEQVEGLLSVCVPAEDDPEAAEWFRSRGLDPAEAEARLLAAVLPRGVPVEPWAYYDGRHWPDTVYRLVLPLVDAYGIAHSVHARSIDKSRPGEPKSLFPAGRDSRRLVLANALARRVLAAGGRGEHVAPQRVVIVEGCPDFLTAACEEPEDTGPMVLGVLSASWDPLFARRIPDGSHVTIATHSDDAGEKYAAKIVETFEGRDVRLLRWRAVS